MGQLASGHKIKCHQIGMAWHEIKCQIDDFFAVGMMSAAGWVGFVKPEIEEHTSKQI